MEMQKKVCVLVADGCEEVEALTPVDYLRRAGAQVRMLGVTGMVVTGSHGIAFHADRLLRNEEEDWDMVVLPGGGPGSMALARSPLVRALVRSQDARKLWVAAICAAPAVVLDEACDVVRGRKFTGYPGTESRVSKGKFTPGRVVLDENLITSRGPGSAGEFALALVSVLYGEEKSESLKLGLVMPD